MKFSEVGVWAVLATVSSAARCARPVSSAVSSIAASSSVPSSEVPQSSSVISSLVPSSVIVPSSAVPSSSIVPSSFVPSSSIASSSTPVSSSSLVIETCGGHQCFAAITAEPTIGESFCSSWLSQTPETTVITETAVVTSTYTSLETATTLLTLATATQTNIIATSTHFLKQRIAVSASIISLAPAPSETILNQCASDDERVSSACSCYLSTTSTVTVYETSTSTAVAEVASTVIETSTTKVIATVEAVQTHTIPANPIVNPAFEGWLSTGSIAPWSTTGVVQIIDGVNPCTASACSGGRVVLRPMVQGLPSATVFQEFVAKPSQTYDLSFVFRCLNFDVFSKIEVWYNNQLKGSTNNCLTNYSFARPTSPIRFTTDATGKGILEFRFLNPSGTPYLYFYFDDVTATAV